MSSLFAAQPITPAMAYPLRHAVLRPHQPPKSVRLAEDMLPNAGHYGILLVNTLIATSSIYPSTPLDDCDGPAWRIRMMAVDPEHRRKGLGHLVLQACEAHAQRHNATIIWCNARVNALPFYEAAGYENVSDPFDIPGIGPHYRLIKKLQ